MRVGGRKQSGGHIGGGGGLQEGVSSMKWENFRVLLFREGY